MAGINILTGDDFFQSAPDFVHWCNVLNNEPTDDEFDIADGAECAWGITEAMLINPPDEEAMNPFSPEVVGYIAEILKAEGIMSPPDVLRIVVQELPAEAMAQFSDDPIMGQAIAGMELQKTDDIDVQIKRNLRTLIAQLEVLPLNNGDAADAVKKALQGL